MRKLKVTLWTGSLATRRRTDWWTINLPYTLTCTLVRWRHCWPVRQGTTPRIHSSHSQKLFFLVGQGWDGRRNRKESEHRHNSEVIYGTSALMSFVLLGLMQAVGAFVVYFTVYAQEGFKPSFLINIRVEWENSNVNDLEDSYGQQWVREGGSAFKVLLLPSSHCLAQTDAELAFPWTALMSQRRWKLSQLTWLVGPFVTLVWPLPESLLSRIRCLKLNFLHWLCNWYGRVTSATIPTVGPNQLS